VSGSELLVKWFEQGCNTQSSDSHAMGNTRDVISYSQSSEGGVNNTTSQPPEDQDCNEDMNVNVSLSPSLQESSVGGDGNEIASLVIPLVPSSVTGAEVPTEGKLHGCMVYCSVQNVLFKNVCILWCKYINLKF